VFHESHNLQFSVLGTARESGRGCHGQPRRAALTSNRMTNLEPFILKHLLDGNVFNLLRSIAPFSLEDDTERPIAYDFAVGITEFHRLASLAVGGNDLDFLLRVIKSYPKGEE
jgi:hypothetical protein